MDFPIPTIPHEIIPEILSYLGKNDLLKCRLLNHSWNELSMKILRNPKYEHYHQLTPGGIEEFLEFWKERKEEWVLPFDVYFYRVEDEELVDYQQITNYIQQLHNIFGEKCVVGLTLSHDSSSSLKSLEELISILTLVAPSITYLDLSKFKLKLQEEEETKKMEEMLLETEFGLTNLSKLISCPPPTYDDEQENNVIHDFLIVRSKDLKELDVISPYDLFYIHNHIASLTKLKIVEPLENIDFYLESMRTCDLEPVLQDLSFTYSTASLGHEILNEFLTSFSTTLQSLTVIFEEIPTTATSFPELSQLTYLRIQVIPEQPNTTRYYTDPQTLSLNSETFPLLETMDISTNVHFGSTAANCWNSGDELSLPTVKSLIVRVTDSQFNGRVTAKDYVDHLQELFPNVTSLTLVNESDGHEEYLNQLLIEFIQSDGAPKIQELEIQDCEKNYLGRILNGLDPDCEPRFTVTIENMELNGEFLKLIKKAFLVCSGGSQLMLSVDKQMAKRDGVQNSVVTCKAPIMHLKMTGLEKIHMSLLNNFNHKSGQSGSEQESSQKDLFLMSLPKHLPLLKQIDISQRMFGKDKEFCKQQIINVQEKYPDLIINTTR